MTMKRIAGALRTLALRSVPFAAPMLGPLLLPASAPAADFVVENTADSGAGSLRQAILDANGNGAADTITFDLAEGDRVILLSSGQLTILNDMADPDLTIDGDVDDDGTADITVDAGLNSRAFFVDFGAVATLRALVITGGSATGAFPDNLGGGIRNLGTLTVKGSTISGNSALNFGGGIYNVGPLTVEGSTISGNNSAGDGGGIYTTQAVTVEGSTISGNGASSFGGGIFNSSGTVIVANSTISDNDADRGGGISNFRALTITNSTISGNRAVRFGSIFNQGGTIETKSTIVAGNTASTDADCNAALTSLGFNLEGGTSCGFTATGDQQNVAVAEVLVTDDVTGLPLLADNGGPTETIALVDADTNPDNPAVDAIPLIDCTDVDDVPVSIDQRGVERPQPEGGNCDIGAFELAPEVPVTIADLIKLFDDAVAEDTLVGAGPGGSSGGRLNALRNMLLTAGALLEQGNVAAGCAQLQDTAKRTDGLSPPGDFAQGEAAADLLEAITGFHGELGCFA
jgi:predicted outer membrane repeat protein